MGTTDKTGAERQRRFRERKAKTLAEYKALQATINELKEDLKLNDAQRWQQLIEKTKGR